MYCPPTAATAPDSGRLTCCPTPKVPRRKIDSTLLPPSLCPTSTQSDLQIVSKILDAQRSKKFPQYRWLLIISRAF